MIKHAYIFFILFAVRASAQPGIEWQRCYGGTLYDEAISVVQTTDGGYLSVGQTLSNNGDVFGNHGAYDYWVVKHNQLGEIEWSKTYGGTGNDWPYSVKQALDGGYILAGFTESNDGDVLFNHGNKDCWIVKLNNIGIIEWSRTYGGSSRDEAWSIENTQDGGYIVAGRTNSEDGDVTNNHVGLDYWVFCLNANGIMLWQRTYGGSSYDNAYSIIQSSDGGYIVAGESASQDGHVIGQHGSSDYWILKLDSFGEIEWQKTLGGSSLDRANKVCEAHDGGFVVAGISSSNDGDVSIAWGLFDYWIIKLSSSGELEWERSYGGSEEDFARDIVHTNDKGFIVTGTCSSEDGSVNEKIGGNDVWVLKLAEDGMLNWQKTLGGTSAEWSNAIAQTADGGYVIASRTASNDIDVSGNHGDRDFWIVKLSPETSSIPETPAGPLLLAPNPAQDYVRIRVPQQEGLLHITLSDATGRILQRRTIPNDSEFDLSGLPVGMYLFSATDKDGRVYAGKVARE